MKIIREQSQPTNWFKSKHKETSANDYWLLYYKISVKLDQQKEKAEDFAVCDII